jgi:hypothetical protein
MTNMLIHSDRPLPLPDTYPDVEDLHDLREFIVSDIPRLINNNALWAVYRWENAIVRVGVDHDNQSGMIEILTL